MNNIQIGTPATRENFGHAPQTGFVYETQTIDPNMSFVIGGNGIEENTQRISIVWNDGTLAKDLPGPIAKPWLDCATGEPVAGGNMLAAMLAEADNKASQAAATHEQAQIERETARAEFEAKLKGNIPELAQAVIVAEMIKDDSDFASDYHGSTKSKTIILAWSFHKRDLFSEMRKAALNHEETLHLNTAPKDAEHRQKYSMGGGYFLKDGSRHGDGWKISKVTFHNNDQLSNVPTGEIALTPPQKAPTTKSATSGATKSSNIEQHTHTKKGFEMWIVTMGERVDRDEFNTLRDNAKNMGGWYSRKWGKTPAGFAFKSLDQAEQFAGALSTPTCNNEHLADKLEILANNMQDEIDGKLADRRQNTPKQRKQAASARQDGNDLIRAQKGLFALATLHKTGEVPDVLKSVTSKKAAVSLACEKLDYSNTGYYDTGRPQGEPSLDTLEARAFWELSGPKSQEQKTADEINALEMKIKNTKIDGFFPTPAPIVARMLNFADINAGDMILEPSAGSGAIVDAITNQHPDIDLTALEINSSLIELLTLKGIGAQHSDFEEAAGTIQNTYDKILMNPPFERGQDIAHVRLAYDCLKPGGRLIAIMSPSWRTNSQAKFSEFRNWIEAENHHVFDNPTNAFKESGTSVSTIFVIIDKPQTGGQ